MSSFSFASILPGNAAAAAAAKSESTTPRTVADDMDDDDDEEVCMPWEKEDWVPTTASGKQKTPNQVRNEFQRYLDNCGRTQGSVLEEIRINNNSFRKFMNPKTYKNQWSAAQNGTYWAAAKLLAKEKHAAKQHAASNKKRKPMAAAAGTSGTVATKKPKTESRADAVAWLRTVMAVSGANTTIVYDSCPELVKKIKQCFQDHHPGVTRAAFCKIALLGSNNNALARFLAAKGQDQSGNQVYPRAYAFFEKLRHQEGQAKSRARNKHEAEQGATGFSTKPPNTHSYYLIPKGTMPVFRGGW